jgi:hypothetical protein
MVRSLEDLVKRNRNPFSMLVKSPKFRRPARWEPEIPGSQPTPGLCIARFLAPTAGHPLHHLTAVAGGAAGPAAALHHLEQLSTALERDVAAGTPILLLGRRIYPLFISHLATFLS